MSSDLHRFEENLEISDIFQNINNIVESSTSYLYINDFLDHMSGSVFLGIVLSKEKAELPSENNNEPESQDGEDDSAIRFSKDSVLIWGSIEESDEDFPHIHNIAKMTCVTIATILVTQGVEVYIQNEIFDPEKGIL